VALHIRIVSQEKPVLGIEQQVPFAGIELSGTSVNASKSVTALRRTDCRDVAAFRDTTTHEAQVIHGPIMQALLVGDEQMRLK